MNYNIEIIRKSENKISTWSGGTTTQFYIYPENAIYAERNFRWRLSSAKVVAEKSVFTPLPGISRILMVIEGEVSIKHQGHHSTILKAFEKDSFSGDWTTRCVGKATDFNLMTDKECSGSMDSFSIDVGEIKEVLFDHKENTEGQFSLTTDAFYIIGDNVKIFTGGVEGQDIHDGDLIMVKRKVEENVNQIEFKNIGDKKVNIIRTIIYY
ncbi:MAG: HutD family protein [Clostridiaceae bacterium]|nr:HutD family protein [Clostridiaceae bacterium]